MNNIADFLLVTHNVQSNLIYEDTFSKSNLNIICRSVRQIKQGTSLEGLKFREVFITTQAIEKMDGKTKRMLRKLEIESRVWRRTN